MKLRKYLDNFYDTVKSIETVEGTIDTKAVIYRNILLLQFSIIIDKKDVSETENIVFLAKYIDDKGVMDLTNYYKELSYLQSIVDRKPSTYFDISLSEFKELEAKIENLITILYSKLGVRLGDTKSEFLALDDIRKMFNSQPRDSYRLDSVEEGTTTDKDSLVINNVELETPELILEPKTSEEHKETVEVIEKKVDNEEILARLSETFNIETITERLADKLNLDSLSEKLTEDLSDKIREDISDKIKEDITVTLKDEVNNSVTNSIGDTIKDKLSDIEKRYEELDERQEKLYEENLKLIDKVKESLKETVDIRTVVEKISKEKFNPLVSPIADEPEFKEEEEKEEEDLDISKYSGGIDISLDDSSIDYLGEEEFELMAEMDTNL